MFAQRAVRQDLRVKNLVKNHCLAKSINDAGWHQFRKWLEHFGKKFGRVTLAVNPAYTSQNCSECGEVVKKSLSTRTHTCKCGCELDRDHNAAIRLSPTLREQYSKKSLGYGGAHRNLGYRPELFRRSGLYCS